MGLVPSVKKATMVVSAVGYKPQQFKVEAGRQAGIDVQLTEESVGLAEVFVVPGSNPALALMDSVRAYGERWRGGVRNEGETAVQVYKSRKRRIPTAELNNYLLPLIQQTPPPIYRDKVVRIKYVTPLPTAVPSFAFFCNLPQYVKDSYKRYLENRIREKWDFHGVPIDIYFRQK